MDGGPGASIADYERGNLPFFKNLKFVRFFFLDFLS